MVMQYYRVPFPMSIPVPLFDRFTSSVKRNPGMAGLASDIADIIGARRARFPYRTYGVLDWGLSNTVGMTPSTASDRSQIAEQIADALYQFEPRLEDVRVVPLEDTADFAFLLEAQVVDTKDESLTLRILSPRRGGGLGADVVVMGAEVTMLDQDGGTSDGGTSDE